MDDPDEQITLADLLKGVCTRSLFIAKLAKRTPSTLQEFMDRANDFVNTKHILKSLINLQGLDRKEIERKTCKNDKEGSKQK